MGAARPHKIRVLLVDDHQLLTEALARLLGPEEDIHEALRTMRHGRVRRLPVVDEEGTLRGILSLNDVVLQAEEGGGQKTERLSYADVVKTYRAICEHTLLPQVSEQPAQQAAGA